MSDKLIRGYIHEHMMNSMQIMAFAHHEFLQRVPSQSLVEWLPSIP